MNLKTMFTRGLLLLLMAAMSTWAKAQSIDVPFLCIEKTNGEVTEIPITDTKPDMWYSISNNNAAGKHIRYLTVNNGSGTMDIPCREIKRLTATMKKVDNGLGDANVDGRIDREDVRSIIYHLLGDKWRSFYSEAADVNRDKKVDITDVTALIKRLLTDGGNTRATERPAPRRAKANGEELFDSYEGQALTINLKSGKSLCSELSWGRPVPRYDYKNHEVVWLVNESGARPYKIEGLKEIVFPTPEQSLAAAREALIELYNATDGDNWKNNTNWCSDKPLDEWYGIETRGYPYVYFLMLHFNDLKGTLPKGFLTKIGPCNDVSLSTNQLSGQLPEDIADNLSVQQLHFSNNNYTGTLPAKVFKLPYLNSFTAGSNHLTGTIPEGCGFLLKYNQLGLSGNDFSGDLPADIVNHPQFHLYWSTVVPQSGHLNPPVIPGYRLDVTDMSGNKLNTTDVYANNIYTLIFNYSSAREDFTSKLKQVYKQYKSKGFEVLGMAPGNAEQINVYLHENDIDWLNLEPKSFRDSIRSYYPYFNFINLVDNQGHVIFSSIMGEDGTLENTDFGGSTRDQEVFDVLEEKFGYIDFTPYASTDYSRDGEVITLQKATVGKGVDIVFMGNCFVDKDMEPGGKYEQKMRQAMEQFFAYEPYTSLRNRFNVYAVKAVSQNAEMYEGCKQAIKSDADAFAYAQKIKTLIPGRPMRVNIIYNAINAGRSFTNMYDDNSYTALMLTGVNDVLNHEAGGHGIGRLYDEYEEASGHGIQPSDEIKEFYELMWTNNGRGANIDTHSSVSQTRWARLAADSRYSAEGLGAYEGSNTYEFGFYRPTQNSMMRFNDKPFNAPSREAIYKYVMQESEGPGWTYDYETFVAFDAKGRQEFADAIAAPSRAADRPAAPSAIELQPSRPPVVIKGTWRDALSHPTPINAMGNR